jgi:hypothetical protein
LPDDFAVDAVTLAHSSAKIPCRYSPRVLDADRAAAYLSKSKFLELVDVKDAPRPLELGGWPRWDRRRPDDWVDAKSECHKKSVKTMAEVLEERRGNLQVGLRQ